VLLALLISLLVLYIAKPVGKPCLPIGLAPFGVALLVCLHALVCLIVGGAARIVHKTGAGDLKAFRVLRIAKLNIIIFTLLMAFVLGWPAFVARLFSGTPWLPFADDALLLLPVIAMALITMASRHRFEKRTGMVRLNLVDYLALRTRTELAVLLMPWAVLVIVSDVTLILFGQSPHYTAIDTIVSVVLVVAMVTFGPVILRMVWETSPLPAGPLRERLEALCTAQHFRCRNMLVWHTRKHVPNAGVVGMLPLLRYVLLTDALLANCTDEEVESIFAHEIGHVKNHHFSFYLLFAIGFMCFYANVVDALSGFGVVEPLGNILVHELTATQAVIMLIFAALYWVFAFGYLSRRLEQQADMFALRVSSNPAALASALQKLGAMSGVPSKADSWRHFSIHRRTDFLREVMADPARGLQAHRLTRFVQLAIVLLFVVSCLRLLV
jgi:Zn-dependent protease with chaperone function